MEGGCWKCGTKATHSVPSQVPGGGFSMWCCRCYVGAGYRHNPNCVECCKAAADGCGIVYKVPVLPRRVDAPNRRLKS